VEFVYNEKSCGYWENDYVIFDDERKKVYGRKDLKKKRNLKMFNDIGFMDFVKEVNTSGVFKKRIVVGEDGVVDGDGALKVRNGNLYDFSSKGRNGVYGYFTKVLLKEFGEDEVGKAFGWLKNTF